MDKLSQVLIELLTSASQPSVEEELSDATPLRAKTYHVVNPFAKSWSADFAADLTAAYPTDTVRSVSFEEWLERLKASAEEGERDGNVDVERNPAIRLIDFYTNASAKGEKGERKLPAVESVFELHSKHLPVADQTTRAMKASRTLRELGPLNRNWVDNWMRQWGIKAN